MMYSGQTLPSTGSLVEIKILKKKRPKRPRAVLMTPFGGEY